MNVVVYVSDALRTDHLGCYGARFVNTKTIDELAAGGVRYAHAISAAPWTAPSTTSIVTGVYAHHHGYLHWDARLDPSVETVFRAFAAHGYEVGSYVFDVNYLFKDLPEANVLGTSETLDTKTGVHVISPEGKLIKFIPIPEDFITNNAFGGPDMKTLYVTAGKTLFKLRTDIAGLPR